MTNNEHHAPPQQHAEAYAWVRKSLLHDDDARGTSSSATNDDRHDASSWVRAQVISNPSSQSSLSLLLPPDQTHLLVLQATSVTNRSYRNAQSHALSILSARQTPYILLDGSTEEHKPYRDELFDVSGKRGTYPQFFLYTTSKDSQMDEQGRNIKSSIRYLGDYQWLDQLNDTVDLSPDVLEAHPDLETWDGVLGKCAHMEGRNEVETNRLLAAMFDTLGGDNASDGNVVLRVEDVNSSYHNQEITIPQNEIAAGNLTFVDPATTFASSPSSNLSLQKQLLHLQSQLHKVQLERDTALAELQEVQIQSNEAAADLVLAKSEVYDRQKELTELRKYMKDKEASLNKAMNENDKLKRDLETMKAERSQIKAADRASSQCGGDIGSPGRTKIKSSELKQRYEELAKVTAAMLRKDAELLKLKSDHRFNLSQKEDEISDLISDHQRALQEKDQQIAKLEQELEKEDATIFGLNRVNEELKSDLDRSTKDAEAEQERTHKEISKLKKKAKKYDKLQSDTQTVYTNYMDELAALREVNEILRNDVLAAKAEAERAQETATEAIDRANAELISFQLAFERVEELRSDTELELVEARLYSGDLEARARECTCKFERERARQPEPLNSWVIICPSLVAVIPSEEKAAPPQVEKANEEIRRAKVELTELEEQVAQIQSEFEKLM